MRLLGSEAEWRSAAGVDFAIAREGGAVAPPKVRLSRSPLNHRRAAVDCEAVHEHVRACFVTSVAIARG